MSKDGGPAFPHPDYLHTGADGTSLRDWFAAHAPAQEIDNMVPNSISEAASYIGITAKEYRAQEHYVQALAKARYLWADQMLKTREATRPAQK